MHAVDEVAEFDMGLEHDPELAATADSSPIRVTRASSWWYYRWCSGCDHTLRRGEMVQVDDSTRAVRHADQSSECDAGEAGGDSADVMEFLEGMQTTWPTGHDLPVASTDDLPFLLNRLPGVGRRPACLNCRHSFRPHETVIVCPCSPFQPQCQHAVHRDPGLGLVCWESWRPSGQLTVCPVTLRELPR
jgi:hypothetical protein